MIHYFILFFLLLFQYCITKERRNDSSPPMRYPVFSMVDKESQPAEAIYSERTSRDKQFEDFVLL